MIFNHADPQQLNGFPHLSHEQLYIFLGAFLRDSSAFRFNQYIL
jgi:hypothetical protein